jgi:multicomponent K+:H+ antiporter subunit G
VSQPVDLPLWAALVVSVLLVGGSALTLVGALGLLRLRSFYERIHAPTLGTTLGMVAVLMASIVYFTVIEARIAFHEILIGVFITITTPITLMLLSRAALYRDRREGKTEA